MRAEASILRHVYFTLNSAVIKLLCAIIIVFAVVVYLVKRHDRNDDDKPEQKQEQDSTPADTTELMMNVANYNFGPTVVLTAPDEKGVIGFHSRRDILLHPQIPQKDEYVRAVLYSFFKTKENIRSQYQQLVESQAQTQSHRRPVGFATSHLSTDSAQGPADEQR